MVAQHANVPKTAARVLGPKVPKVRRSAQQEAATFILTARREGG
jgi:hypothetical protein